MSNLHSPYVHFLYFFYFFFPFFLPFIFHKNIYMAFCYFFLFLLLLFSMFFSIYSIWCILAFYNSHARASWKHRCLLTVKKKPACMHSMVVIALQMRWLFHLDGCFVACNAAAVQCYDGCLYCFVCLCVCVMICACHAMFFFLLPVEQNGGVCGEGKLFPIFHPLYCIILWHMLPDIVRAPFH